MIKKMSMLVMGLLLVMVFCGLAAVNSPLSAWAQDSVITSSSGFTASGFSSGTSQAMVSHTNLSTSATSAPRLSHTISASGIGNVSSIMSALLQDANDLIAQARQGIHGRLIPDLSSWSSYTSTISASGIIDEFRVTRDYRSIISGFQMPQPWFVANP